MSDTDDAVWAFIRASCVLRDRGHGSGTVERTEELLRARPEIATHSIHTAAILGDERPCAGLS